MSLIRGNRQRFGGSILDRRRMKREELKKLDEALDEAVLAFIRGCVIRGPACLYFGQLDTILNNQIIDLDDIVTAFSDKLKTQLNWQKR